MFDDNRNKIKIISMLNSGLRASWTEDKSGGWTLDSRPLLGVTAIKQVYIYALVKRQVNFFQLVAFGATDFSKSFSDNFIEILEDYKNAHGFDDYYLLINPSFSELSNYDMTDSMRKQILRIIKMKDKNTTWSIWNNSGFAPVPVSEVDWLISSNDYIHNYIIYKKKNEIRNELIAIGVGMPYIKLDFIRNLSKYCINHGYCFALNITFDNLIKSYVKNEAWFKRIYHLKAEGWIK